METGQCSPTVSWLLIPMARSVSLAVLLSALLSWEDIQGARILGVLPLWAKSHHAFTQSVMMSLAEAGHQVVVYSPFPPDNPPPNYTHVLLKNIVPESDYLINFFAKLPERQHWDCSDPGWDLMGLHFSEAMHDPQLKKLLMSKESFDIVMHEENVGLEFTFIFSHIFKAPTITLTAFISYTTTNSIFGNSLSMSHFPDGCMPFSNTMNIWQRALNSFSVLRTLYYFHNEYIPRTEALMRKIFPDMPPLTELIHNVSLGFTNAHQVANYPQPLTPNIINVGGIHIKEPKPLPQDIQRFIDEASDGVILFSLGTYVADELLEEDYFQMHINVFKQLPQRVLWKTRKDDIAGLPSNVMTRSWFPQAAILAHSKCVLFITHGGHHSRHETIHFGVPVVGIPQFTDQPRNIEYLVNQKTGVKISRRGLTQETLLEAIRRVIKDPSYKDNMRRLSWISRDLPLTPAQSVVYWTEYVLRHGGAPHLRPASTRLSWYQLALLDVLAVCLAVCLATVTAVGLILRTLYKWKYSTKQDKNKKRQ